MIAIRVEADDASLGPNLLRGQEAIEAAAAPEVEDGFAGTEFRDAGRVAATERQLSDGRDLVLVIDVQGARQVRSRGLDVIAVFVLPPSFESRKPSPFVSPHWHSLGMPSPFASALGAPGGPALSGSVLG